VTDEALSDAKEASAVLLGAIGGPVSERIFIKHGIALMERSSQAWQGCPIPVESGLGRLRQVMGAFGNIRPINFIAPVLIESSSLKERVCAGSDILIVRELSGGIYYGDRQEHDGTFNAASDIDSYDGSAIQRITRLAAWLARSKNTPLPITSLDKANLLAACGRLWRGVVKETIASEFPELTIRHMLIDTAAMTLALRPTTLNGVVLTSNMFGDIISDEASAIPGSLGLLPSASLCEIPENVDGAVVRGLYEPVHGKRRDLLL